MTLAELDRRLKKLNIESETVEIIKRNEFELLIFNKTQLYNFGVDSNGAKLERYSSKYYAKEKNFMNRRPGFGVPDLFVTGAFYNGFFASPKGSSIVFGSRDDKSDKLEASYGSKIFGLTRDNKKIFAVEIVRPQQQQYITKTTGLVFK